MGHIINGTLPEARTSFYTPNNFPIGLHTKLALVRGSCSLVKIHRNFQATPDMKAEKFANHGTTKFLYHDRLDFELEGVEILIGYTHPYFTST